MNNKNRSDLQKARAECFVTPSTEWWRSNIHQVILKEVIDHLDGKDRVKIYKGMLKEL
jgi:hypothetical protein